MVSIESTIAPTSNHQVKRSIPLYEKADWDSFRNHIKEFSSTIDYSGKPGVNNLWQDIKKQLDQGIEKFIPHKIARSRNSLPWITTEVRKLIRKKNKIYTKMKKSGLAKDKTIYKEVKQQTQKMMRQAYWRYVEGILGKEDDTEGNNKGNGNKRFWSYIKHCKQDTTGIAPLLGEDGKKHEDAKSKAEILNNQFTSVFSKLAPCSLKQLTSKVARKHVSDLPPQHQSPHSYMPPITITAKGVDKLLQKLDPHKAAGPDNIKPRVLKELHAELTPILCFLFQLSIDQGKIPDDWRTANVTPIYKKGPKHLASNYRPVSLTCVLCKTLEHIIAHNIMAHLDGNSILSDRQHGFRSKRSCETQLIEFIHELHSNLEKNTSVDIVVMDFAKAFDKVAHEKLLYKLDYYGVQGRTLAWVADFLRHRSQRVVVEGISSDSSQVLSGVPQGSVLGPILFLAYINDLPSYVSSPVRLFADDTIMYRPIKNNDDVKTLQQDLENLDKWGNIWQMEFHPSKCEVMRVCKSRNKKLPTPSYLLQNHRLEVVDHIKYLGITIFQDLNWAKHINNITAKANQKLGFLRRNLRISCPKFKAIAYKSLIRSQLEFCANVWCPQHQGNIHRIEMVQRRAARWALNRYHNTSSVSDMIGTLEWSTLEDRRERMKLIMMYKMVNGLVATNPNNYLTPVTRPTRHSHPYSFITPSCRTDQFKFSFFPSASIAWNGLSAEAVSSPTLETFRAGLGKPEFSRFKPT